MKMFEHLATSYQVNDMPDQVDDDLTAMLAPVSVATFGHLLWEGFMDHQCIRAMQPETRILGTAVTLHLPTADTSLLHYVAGILRPGDIVVIDRVGDSRLASLGGNVALALKLAGAGGAILDGPICDPDEIRAHDFPVWAQGVSPITTRRTTPLRGSLNVPVTCAGVLVKPGDLVIADESGVLCLDPTLARAVAPVAVDKENTSAARRADMEAGAKLGDLTGATARVLDNIRGK